MRVLPVPRGADGPDVSAMRRLIEAQPAAERPRLYVTVYDPDDLPTLDAHVASKSLGTVNAWTELEYQAQHHGTGAFSGRINRHHPQAALSLNCRSL